MARRPNKMSTAHYASSLCEEEQQIIQALHAVPPPPPPDGGWGWVVVLASFLSYAVVDGISFSAAVFLPKMRELYGESYATTSLIVAVLIGSCQITGPFAIALSNNYGCRRVSIAGSLITTVAFLSSLASESLGVFITLFSIFGGIGLSLIYLPAMICVGYYFEKRRGLATGLAMCGSGMGALALAPCLAALIRAFDWEYALVISAGVVLNGAVLGSLYRPLDAKLKKRKKLIMRRLAEDKRIGPQTCVIMQRLLEEKRRQKYLSTGSLDDVLITHSNVFVKQWRNNEELQKAASAAPDARITSSPGSKKSLFHRLKDAMSRSQVNVVSTSQAHGVGVNNPGAAGSSKHTIDASSASTLGGADISPCRAVPPGPSTTAHITANGTPVSHRRTTEPTTPIPTIVVDSCPNSPAKSPVLSVAGTKSPTSDITPCESPIHAGSRQALCAESMKSLPSVSNRKRGTAGEADAICSSVNRASDDHVDQQETATHTMFSSVNDVLLANGDDFENGLSRSERRRYRRNSHHQPQYRRRAFSHSHSQPRPLPRHHHHKLHRYQHHHHYSSMEDVKRFRDSIPDVDRPMYRQDIFFNGSVPNLPEYKHTKTVAGYIENITAVPQRSHAVHPDPIAGPDCQISIGRAVKACLAWIPKPMEDMLELILDFRTLKSPTFFCLCLSTFFTFLGLFIPVIFIMDHAINKGTSAHLTPWLLSMFGAANVVGRAVAGAFTELKRIDELIVNTASLILAGALTLLVPFVDNFNIFLAYMALFGLCIAAFISLRSVIVVQLIGLSKLTAFYGQVLIIQGLAVIIGVPIGGLLADMSSSGNFKLTFFFSGALIVLSGFICFPLRKIANWERKKEGIAVLEYSGDLSTESDDIKAMKDAAWKSTSRFG